MTDFPFNRFGDTSFGELVVGEYCGEPARSPNNKPTIEPIPRSTPKRTTHTGRRSPRLTDTNRLCKGASARRDPLYSGACPVPEKYRASPVVN
eukprot:1190890-Prorocentrum_minimum.AAC.1